MSQTPDVRWRQRFQSFQKAFTQLSAAANLAGQRKLIQARNRSSHTYNEKTANEIAAAVLATFMPEFEAFRATFVRLETSES